MADKTPDIKLKAEIASQRAMTAAQDKSVKSQEEYAKATKDLNTKFKGLTNKLAEVNGDLAISAANIRTGSKDSFEGFLTSRKLAKGMADAANNKELKDATDALVAKQKQQTKEIEENIKVFRAKTEMEALMNEQSKTTNAVKRLDLQEKIDEEQKIIDAESKKVKDAFERDLENLQKNETRIRTAIQTDLEKSTDSKGYSDFTDGLKELSGGMLDIGGFLDDATKKFNAVQNVFGGLGKAANFMTGGMLQQKDASDNLTDSIKGVVLGNEQQEESQNKIFGMVEANVFETSLISKKNAKAMTPFIGKLGIGALILGAFVAAVLTLMARFEGFSDFINKFLLGNRSASDTLQQQKDLNKNYSNKDSKMTFEDYTKQADALKITAEDRLDEKKVDQAVIVGSGAAVGVVKGTANSLPITSTALPDAIASQGQGRYPAGSVDAFGKPNGGQFMPKPVDAPPNKLVTTAKVVAKSSLKTVAKGLGPAASAGLGYMEYLGNVDDTNLQRATLEQLHNDKIIEDEEYDKGLEYIAAKEKEDYMIPFWKAVGGSLATVAAGAFIVSNPVGWGTGLALLAAAGTAGSYAAGGIADVAMGDEENQLAEITGRDTGLNAVGDQKDSMEEMDSLRLGALKGGKLGEGFVDPTPDTPLTMEDIVSMVKEKNLEDNSIDQIEALIKAMGVTGASNISQIASTTQNTILNNGGGQSSVDIPRIIGVF
jgi:hypothetical protein